MTLKGGCLPPHQRTHHDPAPASGQGFRSALAIPWRRQSSEFGDARRRPSGIQLSVCGSPATALVRGLIEHRRRYAQLLRRLVGTQAFGPGLHGLMVDYAASIHIGQRLAGQATALFLPVEPGGQGLLDRDVSDNRSDIAANDQVVYRYYA
jgi:hypothetical protein